MIWYLEDNARLGHDVDSNKLLIIYIDCEWAVLGGLIGALNIQVQELITNSWQMALIPLDNIDPSSGHAYIWLYWGYHSSYI